MKIGTLMKTLWFAFPLTKLVYLFVASQRAGFGDTQALPFTVVGFLTLLGLATATAGGLLGWFLFRSPRLRARLARFAKRSSGLPGGAPYAFWVVALGLAENASIFGLVLSVQSGELRHLVALAICGLVAWAFSYPRLDLVADGEDAS
ncbi:MAG: hypothetical protein JXA15_01510 [Spirochaetales bacterium]|nr:hypothetical protein [Spirochaetales bacterium]